MIAHVFPAQSPLTGTIDPPSSKNYTTRYILVSCLADGESIVEKPAVQDDAVALVRCCRRLGAVITAQDKDGNEIDFTVENGPRVDRLVIRGFGGRPTAPKDGKGLDPDNAGAVLRLLIGVAALCDEEIVFDTEHFKHSLGKRPNRDLVDALRIMGVEIDATGEEATLPIRVRGGQQRIHAALAKRREELGVAENAPVPVPISGAVSSQFLSSLLFVAPLIDAQMSVEVVNDLKSRPLIHTTCSVILDAGMRFAEPPLDQIDEGLPRFVFPYGPQTYPPRTWSVNGDWPGTASILAAAAVVPESSIRLRRLRKDEQGERRCLEFYRAMGCGVTEEGDGDLVFTSPKKLDPAAIDGDTCTDAVLAMMSAAALADGTSRFSGINNLQFKECDRVREPIHELREIDKSGPPLGVRSADWNWSDTNPLAWWEPNDDPEEIFVHGRPEGFEGNITVDGRGDHRVIMMLSVLALRSRSGLRIKGAEHVAKSFPGWFDTLRAMGARVNTE